MAGRKKSLEDMMRAEMKGAKEVRPSLRATKKAGVADVDKVTLYLPKPVYRLIKQMALDFERRPHDLLLEGIDLLLIRYGKSIASVTRK
jgi:hypothetical protein